MPMEGGSPLLRSSLAAAALTLVFAGAAAVGAGTARAGSPVGVPVAPVGVYVPVAVRGRPLAPADRPRSITLADGGRALAAIELAQDATPAERTAADELATYLERIAGARFEVVGERDATVPTRLLVGPSARARQLLGDDVVNSLGPEEFLVRTVGADILLVGGRPRGSLYAAYSFLEDDLGCRWTTWYDDESVPRRSFLAVPPLDRREAPAFAVRDVYTLHTSDPLGKMRFLVRNRLQGPALRFAGDLAAQGGTSHRYGFSPAGGTVHTLLQWMPPEEHFAEHPDWYSLANGRRVADRQLCFANPDLRAALTEVVLEQIGATDPGGIYSISATDVPGALCDCDACRALTEREGTPGAPLLDYLSDMAPRVAERFPEAALSTLAYRKDQSEIPPLRIVLPDNVIVLFAPVDANFAAPLDHASNSGTRRNLEGWTRATTHLWVWYYTNPYGTVLPIGNLHRLSADLRLLHRLGVEGLFVEHDGPGIPDSRRLADLQSWLLAKLLWDPDRDPDELIDDFTTRHYAAAAPLLRNYVAGLESATAAQETSMGWAASAGQYRFLTPDLVLGWQRLLDQAEAAVSDAPDPLARVRQARMSLDAASLTKWRELEAFDQTAPDRHGLVARYRDTYATAVRRRQRPEHVPALLAELEDWLQWYEALSPLRPLPAPLDAIASERVRQLTPESARLSRPSAVLVRDPTAAAGIAATMAPTLEQPPYAPKDLPANALNMGIYDATTGRQQHSYAGKDAPLMPGGYRLYAIGRTTLSEDTYVWFDWSWRIQFADLTAFYDPAEPDALWDVYASLRFEGPAFDSAAGPVENRFFVDRVVLVKAD